MILKRALPWRSVLRRGCRLLYGHASLIERNLTLAFTLALELANTKIVFCMQQKPDQKCKTSGNPIEVAAKVVAKRVLRCAFRYVDVVAVVALVARSLHFALGAVLHFFKYVVNIFMCCCCGRCCQLRVANGARRLELIRFGIAACAFGLLLLPCTCCGYLVQLVCDARR